jgi:hypothetical protein
MRSSSVDAWSRRMLRFAWSCPLYHRGSSVSASYSVSHWTTDGTLTVPEGCVNTLGVRLSLLRSRPLCNKAIHILAYVSTIAMIAFSEPLVAYCVLTFLQTYSTRSKALNISCCSLHRTSNSSRMLKTLGMKPQPHNGGQHCTGYLPLFWYQQAVFPPLSRSSGAHWRTDIGRTKSSLLFT